MDIQAKLNSALKSITVSGLGEGVLAPEQAKQFVKVLADISPMLNDGRRIDMNSHTRLIDRIGYAGRMLQNGAEGAAPTEGAAPVVSVNTLVAKELVGIHNLSDSALEDNIEKTNFQNGLIELLGNQSGYDLEELFINGDTASSDTFLKVTDGWLKKAGNAVVAGVAEGNFDATKVEDLFEKMFLAMPAKYIRNRQNFKFYVTRKIENDYRNVLRTKFTSLGDSAQIGSEQMFYKGIEVQEVPNMPAGTAMLVAGENLVYGIYRDIKIETQRWAAKRSTDFVLSMRVDCHFENEDAVVKATGYTG